MRTLSRHWPEYLIEAVCLGLFMMSAAGFAALLQHPASPLSDWHASPLVQRIPMGVAMGLTAAALIYSPFGRRSGAHMNPTLTLTFLRLGKVAPADALGYVAGQFVGGMAGIAAADWVFRGLPSHPSVNFVATVPGAALFRLRKEDFGEIRHYGGISPAWPITYDELEPYYTKAEHLYQVHGERGVDPTEPWASAPYRFPAVQHEPRIQQLHDDLSRNGLRPFHVPIGIMLDESDPHSSRCIRCDTCDGFPCLVHGKSDAEVICVEPALAHPHVTLLTNARVTRLVTSASGREVTGVAVERNGAEEILSGDIVVSSCGAINSAALLLRSATDRHPQGLANGSGVVGRHYMGHVNSVLLAISKSPNATVFQKTLGVNDFYFGDDGFRYPMGHISFVGKLDAIALSAGAPALVPGMTLDIMAKHSLDFWLTSEDLPDPNNRVTLDRDGNIVLSYTPNNDEGHKRLIRMLEYLLQHLDMHPHLVPRNLFVGNRIPLAGVAHQNGTIRFGRDSQTSALDVNCKAHEVDNLYVVDGSFFPSSGAVNPALTIMANALRVGDHILERLGARAAVEMEAAR